MPMENHSRQCTATTASTTCPHRRSAPQVQHATNKRHKYIVPQESKTAVSVFFWRGSDNKISSLVFFLVCVISRKCLYGSSAALAFFLFSGNEILRNSFAYLARETQGPRQTPAWKQAGLLQVRRSTTADRHRSFCTSESGNMLQRPQLERDRRAAQELKRPWDYQRDCWAPWRPVFWGHRYFTCRPAFLRMESRR